MVLYDHRERRSGIPQRLAARGLTLQPGDLGCADYVLSERLAVVRKSDRDLVPWVTLGRFQRAIRQVTARHPVVVLLVERVPGAVDPEQRRGALARAARHGAAVIEAVDVDDMALWVARLYDQERRAPEDGWRLGLAPKGADADRLAEELVAWLPGVSTAGARRLLTHFGSVRALGCAGPEEIEAVPGFGPRRAAAIADLLGHRYGRAGRTSRPTMEGEPHG